MIRIEAKRYDTTHKEPWWKVGRFSFYRYDSGSKWLFMVTGRSLRPGRGWYVTVEPV